MAALLIFVSCLIQINMVPEALKATDELLKAGLCVCVFVRVKLIPHCLLTVIVLAIVFMLFSFLFFSFIGVSRLHGALVTLLIFETSRAHFELCPSPRGQEEIDDV